MVNVALWPSGLVTTTLTTPAVCAGVDTVMEVAVVAVTVAAVPPKVTFSPATKFAPVMVTVVPPEAVPDVGERLETVGAGPW